MLTIKVKSIYNLKRKTFKKCKKKWNLIKIWPDFAGTIIKTLLFFSFCSLLPYGPFPAVIVAATASLNPYINHPALRAFLPNLQQETFSLNSPILIPLKKMDPFLLWSNSLQSLKEGQQTLLNSESRKRSIAYEEKAEAETLCLWSAAGNLEPRILQVEKQLGSHGNKRKE